MAVGGFYLRELEVDPEEERNVHGANVRILPKGGGEAIEESLLFGDYPDRGWTAPLTLELDGKRWAVNLTKQRMSLPFRIRLEDFTKLEHPGTMKAKEYMSDVTKLNRDGTSETSLIEMNKPLRSDGFTVYQASWEPEGAGEGQPLFTSLAVSRNPADQMAEVFVLHRLDWATDPLFPEAIQIPEPHPAQAQARGSRRRYRLQ